MSGPHSFTDLMLHLPKPTAMQFGYERDWSSEETMQYGAMADGNIAGAIKSFGAAAADTALPNGSIAALESKYHLDINKRNKAIFKDLPFRRIDFTWVLKPRSDKMAKKFMETINELKFKSAPALAHDGALWDVSDCTWTLEIQTGAPTSLTIFKSMEMVIQSIQIDYTPNGFWSQHKDGFPTQIGLQIQMMELQLAYREMLEGGGGKLV